MFEVKIARVDQDRCWAKPNETLILDPRNFWKELYRKKFSKKKNLRCSNLPKKIFRWNFYKVGYSPLNLMSGSGVDTWHISRLWWNKLKCIHKIIEETLMGEIDQLKCIQIKYCSKLVTKRSTNYFIYICHCPFT